ncbi:metallophosphoesterase, partial [Nodularia sphaerocarpa CS-585A2]|nr:metallophosphoesterase [Nodularia sphaerocarpa CS-585A2]
MNLKRRQFLFLGTLGTMGTGLVGWKLARQNLQITNIADSPVIAATPPKKDLLLRFTSV